jgi:succinate dehydrogenase/fumarate reductase flavoprotein subunit
MAKQRVMVVGGGLAGLSVTMKLAELGIHVDLMSLVPVKRSHSVCAQGGINSCNEQTRELGDSEWQHFDDTVYGGDFLQHQPLVKEMAYWGPKVIDVMDRLGVPFNRTTEGYLDRRRFGGTLYKRTAFAGATTGQQLLYALDEQVRRWEAEGLVTKYEFWDFLAPVLDESRCLPRLYRPGSGLDGDPRVSSGRGGPGHRRLRFDLRPLDQFDVLQRDGGKPSFPSGREVRQRRVHPGPSDGGSRRR